MDQQQTRVLDVTKTAREAGFDCQVYLTEEVWEACVDWDDEDTRRQDYQEWDARLWDVLFVPAMKLQMGLGSLAIPGGMEYEIHCLLRDKESDRQEADLIRLRVLPVESGDGGNSLLISF